MEPPEAASSPPSSSPFTAIAASATAAAASPSPLPSSSSGELSSSSSSSLPAAASSSSSDGARISSSSAALAREAASLFQSRHYQECLDVLQQLLLQKEEENPKVLHNIAVVEYLHEGGTDPQKLLNVLSVVKRRNEELSRNISEQLDGINSSSPSSANPSGTKGSNSMASAAGPSPDMIASTEDFDTSISTFNTAVILYHLRQYAAALSMLEPLYQNIEPIDEPAALGICLLILDITLLSCQLRKAADVFQYMERVFGLGFLSTPSESSNLVPSHLVPSSATDSASNVGNTSVTVNSPVASTIPEPSLTRSSSEEVLDEEVLSLSLDMEGSNLGKLAGPLSMLTNSTRISLERSPPVLLKDSNVKILLHLYKVRLLLCSHNIRAAKREVKLAMNLARGHDYLTALNLKAQVEYSRGNHRKAVKLLMTCNNREPGMRCIFLNNLGCIHHHLRKDHAAYFYFVKAFQSCASAALEKPLKLSSYSQDKSLFILYNCGLQQLRNGNPLLAARCFQEAGSLFHNQPFYWLRLAECCILALEKGLLEAGGYHASIKKDELRVSSVGDGEWRKVVLPSGSLNPTLLSTSSGLKSQDAAYGGAPTRSSSHSSSPLVNGTDYFPPGKSHKLSLVFARHCLQNVVHLLNRLDARAVADADPRKSEGDFSESIQKGGSSMGGTVVGQQCSLNGNNKESKGGSTNTVSTSVCAFEDEKRKHNKSIFLYVLADIAFVELCLENPVRALRSAQKLLLQPECTKAFKFLGHMYAAEALCLLSRPREALNHLATCMIESSSVEIPHNGGDEDGHRWKSGENSEASGEGDDGGSIVAGNSRLGSLPEALNISSLTGIRARASLFVNLAMVHIMQGDLSQAHQFAMQAVSITPANPLAVLSVVYVELVQGRTREAVASLKHCRHLCVLSSKLGC